MPSAIAPNYKQAAKDIAQNEAVLGGYAYQIIRQQSKRIFKLRSPVIADTDPENLHQMRVGTRRLRSALDLFSDVVVIGSGSKGFAKASKSVKRLTKTLGKVRDLDVMQQWFEQILTSEASAADAIILNKEEKKTIQKLLKKIEESRKKQFAKLEETLEGSGYQKLVRQFKRWVKRPKFSSTAEQSAQDAAVQGIIQPIIELIQHPGWLLATQQQNDQTLPVKDITLDLINQQLAEDGEQLHELRKQIKQIRYQTEFFRGLYDITYAAQVREFRTLQQLLGQLQDQIVVSDFLTNEIGEKWANKLPSIYQSFQDSRVALWQQWQPYQQKYLKLRSKLPVDSLTA
ncbi:MAG: hypothetical protein DCF25_15410 [Leptolyngbya foveolarum]|uniref:CHAD domain-containing protein n=1 Tax=Leptolyngbya foveolarum TaxID=47253 RepID=A0A2W4TZ66_9CYAN|nr:MAG: hypothetical protein DCF25_15410 [Leptolyngbya foveolarum]